MEELIEELLKLFNKSKITLNSPLIKGKKMDLEEGKKLSRLKVRYKKGGKSD